MNLFDTCNRVKSEFEQRCSKKKAHRNQYSQPEILTEQPKKKRKLEQYKVISIPNSVKDMPVIRLKHNIHFPYDYYPESRLGSLGIHSLSFNYKVIRTDIVKDLYTFTYEPISREITEFKPFHLLMSKRNPQLAQFMKYYYDYWESNPKSNDEVRFDQIPMDKPLDCHYNILTSNGLISTQRIMNQKYLDMMGVSPEMLDDYIKQTSMLPSPVFAYQNDHELRNYTSIMTEWAQKRPQQLEIINYQGQRFTATQTFCNFSVRCPKSKRPIEISLWYYDCDSRWTSPQQTESNTIEYFQIAKDKSLQKNRCGIKYLS